MKACMRSYSPPGPPSKYKAFLAVHISQIPLKPPVFSQNPAVLEEIDEQSTPENLTSLVLEANVRWSMRQILESPEGRARVAENRYKLVGAVYEISSGRVRFL
jgi:carbonic anhydrase